MALTNDDDRQATRSEGSPRQQKFVGISWTSPLSTPPQAGVANGTIQSYTSSINFLKQLDYSPFKDHP